MIFLTFLFFQLSFGAGSANQAYYFGSGGEAKESPSRFDESFLNFRAMEDRGWNVKYLFDGSHERSREYLTLVGSKGARFSKLNFLATLKSIEQTLQGPGPYPAQLLLYIDSHGAFNHGKYLISTDDGQIDVLPQLTRIKELAAQKKIKLGIVGGTCYSGNLLPLADDNTCVVTNSPSDTVSIIELNGVMSKAISSREVRNLEDLHLQSRVTGKFKMSQPLISTSAGRKAYEVLNPLRREMVADNMELPEPDDPCKLDHFTQAIRNLQEISQKVVNETLKIGLKEKVEQLKKISQRSREFQRKYGPAFNETFRLECVTLPTRDQMNETCFRNTREAKEIKQDLQHKKEKLVKLYENPENDGKDRARFFAHIDSFSQLIEGVELAEKSPLYKKKLDAEKSLPKNLSDTAIEISMAVAALERDLYNNLYEYFSSLETGSNICRDFQLEGYQPLKLDGNLEFPYQSPYPRGRGALKR